jgi:arsenite methyltransferase
MRRSAKPFIGLLVTAASAQEHHQQHKAPASAAEYAKVLENPERDAWQRPREVIDALALRKGELVADLGAGSGYFTRRLAHHASKVYAVDLDAKLLEMAKASSPSNVETVLAAADDPKLAEASVDTVFICDVLHHIDGRPAYLAKLAKALKPGGRIAVVDFHKRPLPVGPPPGMKLTPEEVRREFETAGFTFKTAHTFLPHQYFLEFTLKQVTPPRN